MHLVAAHAFTRNTQTGFITGLSPPPFFPINGHLSPYVFSFSNSGGKLFHEFWVIAKPRAQVFDVFGSQGCGVPTHELSIHVEQMIFPVPLNFRASQHALKIYEFRMELGICALPLVLVHVLDDVLDLALNVFIAQRGSIHNNACYSRVRTVIQPQKVLPCIFYATCHHEDSFFIIVYTKLSVPEQVQPSPERRPAPSSGWAGPPHLDCHG